MLVKDLRNTEREREGEEERERDRDKFDGISLECVYDEIMDRGKKRCLHLYCSAIYQFARTYYTSVGHNEVYLIPLLANFDNLSNQHLFITQIPLFQKSKIKAR